MAQLTDDCFAQGERLMRVDEALAAIAERVACVAEPEPVALAAALGRILAEDIVAPADVPPHDNSAVDGYAVAFRDLAEEGETRLPVTGRAAAGHPLERPLRRGEAVRIFTGARMPEGADTVVMQEDARLEDDAVVVPAGLRQGANRRKRGEDITAASVVLARGRRLQAQDLGQAASAGRPTLQVARPLRAAVFSTGDEITEPGEELAPGHIYDSNRYTITGLLQGLGCRVDDLGILPDRYAAVRDALARAGEDHGLIVTSGGVSVGEEDHVKQAVEAQGALHLWRLAVKPGRPIALGQVGRVPFVGLPGNPVAVMVTFVTVVRPLILRLMGGSELTPHTYRVPAAFDHRKKKDRREWLRARLVADGNGGLQVEKYPRQGSGILSSIVESDGLVELPEEMTRLDAGSMVDFLPFSEVTA